MKFANFVIFFAILSLLNIITTKKVQKVNKRPKDVGIINFKDIYCNVSANAYENYIFDNVTCKIVTQKGRKSVASVYIAFKVAVSHIYV
jgi:hypothetical protein